MIDFTARTSYRGTAELTPINLRTRRTAMDETRGSELSEAIAGSTEGPARRRNSVTASALRQEAVTLAADRSAGWALFSRRDSTAAASTTSPPAGSSATSPGRVAEPAAEPLTRAEADALVVDRLKQALTAAGVSFESLGLAAHEDVVAYPGGSYIHRYISVRNNLTGHVDGLMTDLVAMNPQIAVVDIQRMLGMV